MLLWVLLLLVLVAQPHTLGAGMHHQGEATSPARVGKEGAETETEASTFCVNNIRSKLMGNCRTRVSGSLSNCREP